MVVGYGVLDKFLGLAIIVKLIIIIMMYLKNYINKI